MAKSQPPAKTEARLPSILELGKMLAATENACDQFDEAALASEGSEKRQFSAALDLANERVFAIWDLIASMPAKTLADAAVQLRIACGIASILTSSDYSEKKRRADLKKLERIVLSVLPLVAEAAGLDMTEMNFHTFEAIRSVQLGIVENLP